MRREGRFGAVGVFFVLALGFRVEGLAFDADFFVLAFIPVVFFLEAVFFREDFLDAFFLDASFFAGRFFRLAARFVDFFLESFFLPLFFAAFLEAFFEVFLFATFFEAFFEAFFEDFFFEAVLAAVLRVLARRGVLACFRLAFADFFVLPSFFFFLAAAFRAGMWFRLQDDIKKAAIIHRLHGRGSLPAAEPCRYGNRTSGAGCQPGWRSSATTVV